MIGLNTDLEQQKSLVETTFDDYSYFYGPFDDDGYENIRDGNLGAYHTYDEIMDEITQLEEDYRDIVEIEIIGTTWEGRPIPAVHITNKNIDGDKPSVLFTGQTHAREVISAEVALGLIDEFTSKYETDEKIHDLVDNRDIWIVPCVNPDGSMIVAQDVAEYNDSSWRKNARDNNGSGELDGTDGVDLNRNYTVGFGGRGTSDVPGSQIYTGPYALSEPETQAIANLAERERFVTSAHLHSFSGLILHPIGYTEGEAPDHELLSTIGNNMQSLQKHEKYTVEKSSDLYVCGGAEDDYLYETYGTLAFTIEIGFGYYGFGTFRQFNPPEDKIGYHVENNIDMLVYLAEIADDPHKVLDEAPEVNDAYSF